MTTPTRIRPGVVLETENGQKVRVEAWRGEGSYARVYHAVRLPDNEAGAVKVAKRETPEAAVRLAHERRILAAVQHPRVVRLLGAGCAYDSPFLLLEWLDGETLRDLVAARRRLPLRQALELFTAACEAVAAIHASALVHGDIRAENLIVIPKRGAVLTDPGLPLDDDQPHPGAPGDLLRLGDLLYLMLTGRHATPDAPLSANGGFNRAVVTLWESTRHPAAITAHQLAQTAAKIQRTL
ncbi:MAG: protein kinase domain-containing protein [Actinomycetota bacterium]